MTKHAKKKWSADVTAHSDALDLERDVFKSDDPEKIAQSLKRSAERTERRKSAPFGSAMSMLTFYLNRGGGNLSDRKKHTLERAKGELRRLFGRALVSSCGNAQMTTKSSAAMSGLLVNTASNAAPPAWLPLESK
jgi:hypothetical protein